MRAGDFRKKKAKGDALRPSHDHHDGHNLLLKPQRCSGALNLLAFPGLWSVQIRDLLRGGAN
jgi:hypothetical protein